MANQQPKESKIRLLEWFYEHQLGDTDVDFCTPVFEHDAILYHLEAEFENFVGHPLLRIMLYSESSFVVVCEQRIRPEGDRWVCSRTPLPVASAMFFCFRVFGGITGATIKVRALVHAL